MYLSKTYRHRKATTSRRVERIRLRSTRSFHAFSSNKSNQSSSKKQPDVDFNEVGNEGLELGSELRNKKDDTGIMSFVVGGRLFQTFTFTLIPKQGTRLSWLAQHDEKNDPPSSIDFEFRDGVYYFDRDPEFFSYIMQYYRTDELHLPATFCVQYLRQELAYWGISDSLIQPCCVTNFKSIHEAITYVAPLEKRIDKIMHYREENFVNYLNKKNLSRRDRRLCYLRTMFDDVYGMSKAGKMYSVTAVIMTIIQLICTSSMTVSTFRSITVASISRDNFFTLIFSDISSFLTGIDIMCLVYFILEYIIRFYAARRRKKFFFNFLNINDCFCNLFCLATVICILTKNVKSMTLEIIFYMARSLRVLRFFRYMRRLEVLVITCQCCVREIILFGLFNLLGIVISGTLIYLAELIQEQGDNNMWNLFTALYFATSTWTTIGFGDMVPKSTLSMILTLILCWVASITVLLPIPLMANNFSFFYRHFHHMIKRADLRGRQRMKRILERFVEEDPQVLYISTMSSTSSVSA